MRYAKIYKEDFNNAKGVSITIFFQGCLKHCEGCFNKETWDCQGGKDFTAVEEEKIISLIKKEYISSLVYLGGEPLLPQNILQLLELTEKIIAVKPSIKLWCYTGYTYEELLKRFKDEPALKTLLSKIDVLVDGPFMIDQKDITLAFKGSRNQRIINLKETTEDNIVLLDI